MNRTNKAAYTSTRSNQGNSSDVNQGHSFTHDDPPAPFGWQGEKHARRAAQAPPRAAARSLGNMEPGRLSEFEQGGHESFDAKARTAAVMIGTFAAVKAWSAWRGHQRQQGR